MMYKKKDVIAFYRKGERYSSASISYRIQQDMAKILKNTLIAKWPNNS